MVAIENESREKGRAEGRAEGELEGKVAVLRSLLVKRFGELPDWAQTRLLNADVTRLERWSERILEAQSLADFFE
uniref:DUF4351 domain-containing protein n=1 Tax=Candidatus Kentrum sp. FW TaxID=2126338 RepID=A0A450TDD9_9GAMM|nr:MAG: protein of unknown function (DUF4351) [Candidatus Kentron sp. FW]